MSKLQVPENTTVRDLLHKLNNDLSLVMGYIDLASRSAKTGPAQIVQRLEAARDAAKRMAGSISEAQKKVRTGKVEKTRNTGKLDKSNDAA